VSCGNGVQDGAANVACAASAVRKVSIGTRVTRSAFDGLHEDFGTHCWSEGRDVLMQIGLLRVLECLNDESGRIKVQMKAARTTRAFINAVPLLLLSDNALMVILCSRLQLFPPFSTYMGNYVLCITLERHTQRCASNSHVWPRQQHAFLDTLERHIRWHAVIFTSHQADV
jgi:hypothetical protein